MLKTASKGLERRAGLWNGVLVQTLTQGSGAANIFSILQPREADLFDRCVGGG